MINIYKSLISSIIVYGSPIILTADQMVWKRLQVLQNKALRAALELPVFTSVEYIHKVSNIHKTKDYALELLHKAIQKATTNNDIVLQDHLNSIFERIWKQSHPYILRIVSWNKTNVRLAESIENFLYRNRVLKKTSFYIQYRVEENHFARSRNFNQQNDLHWFKRIFNMKMKQAFGLFFNID